MYQLKIELIGDDTRELLKLARMQADEVIPGLGAKMIGFLPPRSWVAEVVGFDDKYGFRRRFLRPNVDYSHANAQGSRGVFAYYNLGSGIYDVKAAISWRKSDRYYCRVEDDVLVTLSTGEVVEWLKNRSA